MSRGLPSFQMARRFGVATSHGRCPLCLAFCFAALLVGGETADLGDASTVYATCRHLEKGNQVTHGCVIKQNDGSWALVDASSGEADNCVASGTFVDSAQTISNFGKLRVVTNGDFSDLDQAYAAGFLEGHLTAGTQGPPLLGG
jgi:hypothetical protein